MKRTKCKFGEVEVDGMEVDCRWPPNGPFSVFRRQFPTLGGTVSQFPSFPVVRCSAVQAAHQSASHSSAVELGESQVTSCQPLGVEMEIPCL